MSILRSDVAPAAFVAALLGASLLARATPAARPPEPHALLPPPPALVEPEPSDEEPGGMAFPLDGPARILDTFGEARGGGRRTHEGVDMMSPRRTPVLAAADGVVSWAHDEVGGRCCDLEIRHEGGWRTRYIHLDNDTPGTDDGLGYGIAEGVVEGARVRRGQVIGWVGDSGNAEACDPHLHFELRGPDGRPVDPRPLLLRLQSLPAGTVLAPSCAGAEPGA